MTPDLAPPAPIPIVALDVPGASEAFALVEGLPRVEWVKVGLQLFAAAGPEIVLALRDRGLLFFLDVTFLDIPNTVARDSGMDGVVASVLELPAIREHAPELSVLTPGIRFADDDAGDQTRVASPARAAQLGADSLGIGRSGTAAAHPAAAFARLLAVLAGVPR
jgi:orotidine-5'-phosphate decarboxylase